MTIVPFLSATLFASNARKFDFPLPVIARMARCLDAIAFRSTLTLTPLLLRRVPISAHLFPFWL
jgi:hypothetical protein